MADPSSLRDQSDDLRPRLAPGVIMRDHAASNRRLLVFPEAIVELKGPGPAIVNLCDGRRTVREILQELARQYDVAVDRLRDDVWKYLRQLTDKRLVQLDQSWAPEGELIPSPPTPPTASTPPRPIELPPGMPRPLGLIAELTYRCPLHCPYCSNPIHVPAGQELSTGQWRDVLKQSAALGMVHALFTGGEPLARPDLEEIISAAHDAGLYTNLITSAVGLTSQRIKAMKSAGLHSVQISFQADESTLADAVAGTSAHALKLEAARLVRQFNFPLTINVVLHRENIDRIGEMIALAEQLDARRLELANVQFYGWALRNRKLILPTTAQIERARDIAALAQKRLAGVMDVLYVVPDYFDEFPKPCMNGWASRYIAVNPHGEVLPCPTASEIPDMRFDNIRDHSLEWIWTQSESFNRYRGYDWMPQPCRSCDRRTIDYGGCRCQAAIVTGDASVTDPVCIYSPNHGIIKDLIDPAQTPAAGPLVFRTNPKPKRISLPVTQGA